MRWYFHHVFAKDAAWNNGELRVRTVIEDEVFTKIRLVTQAEETLIAWRGIRGDHSHTRWKSVAHRFSGNLDNAGKLMAEYGRRRDHPRVVALLPDFKIGSAGESDFDSHQQIFGTNGRDCDFLDLEIFGPIQHGRRHVSIR